MLYIEPTRRRNISPPLSDLKGKGVIIWNEAKFKSHFSLNKDEFKKTKGVACLLLVSDWATTRFVHLPGDAFFAVCPRSPQQSPESNRIPGPTGLIELQNPKKDDLFSQCKEFGFVILYSITQVS